MGLNFWEMLVSETAVKAGLLMKVKGNQADAQGEVADFFIQRAPRKLRGKENEKREGKEKERKRGDARLLAAIWHSKKRAEAIF